MKKSERFWRFMNMAPSIAIELVEEIEDLKKRLAGMTETLQETLEVIESERDLIEIIPKIKKALKE